MQHLPAGAPKFGLWPFCGFAVTSRTSGHRSAAVAPLAAKGPSAFGRAKRPQRPLEPTGA